MNKINLTTNYMRYQQIIDSCFEEVIGTNGLSKEYFAQSADLADNILQQIKVSATSGDFPIINHLQSDVDLDQIIEIGDKIRDQFDELVVLGTGGSTLNPQSLVALTQPHGGIDKRVYFIDSVDPFTINAYIQQLDLTSTAFLVTSKSGRTNETIVQFITFLLEYDYQAIRNKGNHFFVITDPADNPIREIAKKINATIIDHEVNIGGRFATFTNVGLIPAAVAGVDIVKIRSSAKDTMLSFLNGNNAPAIGAALQYSFMQKNISKTVIMPYIDRLSALSSWYKQIWAESLGKDGKGNTPIKAVGALDQHSQLQLYLDGPKDKFFNLITLDTERTGNIVNNKYLNKEIDYLNNAALQKATKETLINNGCPVRHIKLTNMNEESLAALMSHFILETVITAGMLKLNAFDQPAVEEGKIIAKKILSSSIK